MCVVFNLQVCGNLSQHRKLVTGLELTPEEPHIFERYLPHSFTYYTVFSQSLNQ